MRLSLLPLKSLKDLATLSQNLQSIENAFNKLLPAEVPETVSGSYTGTDAAARIVACGFTPRRVTVYDATDGVTFEAIGSGLVDLDHWYRVAAGTHTQDDTQWQGIIPGGFKCGSAAANASNLAGRVYRYFAQR